MKKKLCLLCSAMVFLVCRSFILFRRDMEVMMDTMELFNKAAEPCEYSIPGVGKIYMDQPIDEVQGCLRKTYTRVRRDTNTNVNRLSDLIEIPLELYEFNPRRIRKQSKDVQEQKMKSDMNQSNRTLPDMRSEQCKSQAMLIRKLPRASIIVTMHNTDWSVLIRMLHSIIDTAPTELVEEIIIVDDASDVEHLQSRLDSYIKAYTKVKKVRIPDRVGYLMARNKGAELASAPVLIFLNADTECSPGWMEPLLERIAFNRSTIVSPSIDSIDRNTLEYIFLQTESVGGFNWNLMFTWKSMIRKESNPDQPIMTPTLPGGNFAIDKDLFNILGQHDPVMDILDFSNLELSIKCWLCGGRLEIIPCSHVGQVEAGSDSDLTSSQQMILNASMRTAEVWFGEYKSYFYDRVGEPSMDLGDMSRQQLIKQSLQCHPFKWYHENVYPDLFIPGHSEAAGEMRNPWSALCIDSGVNSVLLPLRLFPCHDMGGHQFWIFSELGEIRRDEVCLDYAGQGENVVLYPCHGTGGNQEWVMDKSRILHKQSRKCLTVSGNDTPTVPLPDKPETRFAILTDCQENVRKQEWVWFWRKA